MFKGTFTEYHSIVRDAPSFHIIGWYGNGGVCTCSGNSGLKEFNTFVIDNKYD